MLSFSDKIKIVAISKNIGSKCYPERMSLIVLRLFLEKIDLMFIS